MAMVDLYRTLKREAVRVFMEEREKRKRAMRLRLEVQKKSFDKREKLH